MSDKRTEPKELARQARLLLNIAKTLRAAMTEITAPELLALKHREYEDLCIWQQNCNNALDSIVKVVITQPELRIAVFHEAEEK